MRPSVASTSRTRRSGSPARRELGGDVERLADAGRPREPRPVVATARAFGGEEARGLQADAAGRAGDETDGVAQAEIHGWLA